MSFSRRKRLFITLKRTLVQGNYYRKTRLVSCGTWKTRLVTHSTHLTTRSTRSTRLSTRSTRFSSLSTRLSIHLSIRSTRLSTRSIRLSSCSICLFTRSNRSTICQSFYNWSESNGIKISCIKFLYSM